MNTEQVKNDLADKGYSKISCGVYLTSKEAIIRERIIFEKSKEAKKIDFTVHNFWITDENNGVEQQGFDSIEEALKIPNTRLEAIEKKENSQ